MISERLARQYFFVRFGVVHSTIDALKDLSFRQAGIFQTSNLRARKGRLVLKAALQHSLYHGIRQPDETQGHGIAAKSIEFIGGGDLQNLLSLKPAPARLMTASALAKRW